MRTHPSPPRLRRAVLIGTAATALALLPALPASAHDQLIGETPAAGSTVTGAPDSVALTFSAALLELGGGRNAVTVTDAAGRHFETACATVSGADLTAPVRLGAAGTYSVTWRAVSSDGHPVGSTYTFGYRPAAGTAAAEGSTDGPCGAAATASEQDTAPAGLPGGALATGAIAGGVLLAAVAAVLVVVLRTRRGIGPDAGPTEQETDR